MKAPCGGSGGCPGMDQAVHVYTPITNIIYLYVCLNIGLFDSGFQISSQKFSWTRKDTHKHRGHILKCEFAMLDCFF